MKKYLISFILCLFCFATVTGLVYAKPPFSHQDQVKIIGTDGPDIIIPGETHTGDEYPLH